MVACRHACLSAFVCSLSLIFEPLKKIRIWTRYFGRGKLDAIPRLTKQGRARELNPGGDHQAGRVVHAAPVNTSSTVRVWYLSQGRYERAGLLRCPQLCAHCWRRFDHRNPKSLSCWRMSAAGLVSNRTQTQRPTTRAGRSRPLQNSRTSIRLCVSFDILNPLKRIIECWKQGRARGLNPGGCRAGWLQVESDGDETPGDKQRRTVIDDFADDLHN